MRRPSILALAAVLALLGTAVRAEAWGFDAHKFIMGRAISLLPPQIRPFFEADRASIVERSIDPDLWRLAGFEDEPARHFVDLDAYGAPPFRELPRNLDEAIKKFGKEFVEKNGTLPWRTEEFFRRLVEAFELKSPYARGNIRFYSSILAHYVSDGHVPLHAALNYDGQLTNQWGIHSRFEADLFERYRARLRVVPGPLAMIRDPRDFMFDTLVESFTFVQPLLDADRQAVEGKEVYDEGYYALFFGKVRPVLERRLSESVNAVASMITSAWTAAGRLPLPVQNSPAPKKIRRQ